MIGQPAPWQAEPYRLWSLLDMLRLFSGAFTIMMPKLHFAKSVLEQDHLPADDRYRTFADTIEEIIPYLAKLPLAPAINEQIASLWGRAGQARRLQKEPLHDLAVRVDDLINIMQHELTNHIFLCVPYAQAQLYDEPEKWFGEPIVAAFPDARFAIRDAVRCLALDQWTASVYNSMVVLEHGLRTLANRLNVQFSRPVQVEQWKNVIDQIEKQIRAMEQLPKTPQRDQELAFYSRAASHFFYVKEAWRNFVMHAREVYDESEATRVLTNVRDFMQALV